MIVGKQSTRHTKLHGVAALVDSTTEKHPALVGREIGGKITQNAVDGRKSPACEVIEEHKRFPLTREEMQTWLPPLRPGYKDETTNQLRKMVLPLHAEFMKVL